MATISTNDLKNGMTLQLEGTLFDVVDFQHVKPGKGGAFVRTTLKNTRTGAQQDRTFRADEKVERAIIDKREMQYLYRDGGDYVYRDNTTNDQLNVAPETLGAATGYLVEGATAQIKMHDEDIIGIELPAAVELKVAETEPGLRGDTASGGARKPATLETGLVVQVPLFVDSDDTIKVDTRTGDYLTRA
jgi:elongation factor P